MKHSTVDFLQINIESTLSRISEKGKQLLNLLFTGKEPGITPWFIRITLVVLYAAGIGLWGIFLNWGNFTYTFQDWQMITGPRLSLLQDAVNKAALPLHISNPYTLFNFTDRFLSMPDQILSPQILLLRFVSIYQFVILDVILLYTAGFLGLLWFRRKFSLSLFAFAVLFTLFNFNGHILAHYAIGHFTWGGYFLFPWFAGLVYQLVEGERGWGWIAKMSLLLFAMELQGSFHQFVWCLIFLGFLAFTRRNAFLTVLGGMIFAVLINMVRILPPALLYGQFNDQYLAGYQTLTDIWNGMVSNLAPYERTLVPMMTQDIQRWELTLFIGLVGAFFLLYFGIYRWMKRESNRNSYLILAFPVAATFMLSFDRIYHWVRILNIPLLNGERVSSRIISLPFVFVLLFGVDEFQRWLDQPRKNRLLAQISATCLFIIGGHDLWQNYRGWMVTRISSSYRQWGFNPLSYYLTNHPDAIYTNYITLGAVISMVSILLVLFLAFRTRHKLYPTKNNIFLPD